MLKYISWQCMEVCRYKCKKKQECEMSKDVIWKRIKFVHGGTNIKMNKNVKCQKILIENALSLYMEVQI